MSADPVRRRLFEELWSRDARYYEMAREQVRGAAAKEGEYSFLRRHLPATGKVLEVGCGEGSNLAAVARAGLRLAGCDLSSIGLAMARHDAPRTDPPGLVLADAEALPFSEGAFNAVFAVSLLEHLPDPERVLDQMIASLAPEGRLVLISPQYGAPLGASPCRRGGGGGRFVRRLLRAHLPRRGGERLEWDRVAPLVLEGAIYDGDLDTIVEPELGSLVRFLEQRGLHIEEATSGYEWHTWRGRTGSFAQRAARALFETLGRAAIPPYRSFGPLIAVCAVKAGRA